MRTLFQIRQFARLRSATCSLQGLRDTSVTRVTNQNMGYERKTQRLKTDDLRIIFLKKNNEKGIHQNSISAAPRIGSSSHRLLGSVDIAVIPQSVVLRAPSCCCQRCSTTFVSSGLTSVAWSLWDTYVLHSVYDSMNVIDCADMFVFFLTTNVQAYTPEEPLPVDKYYSDEMQAVTQITGKKLTRKDIRGTLLSLNAVYRMNAVCVSYSTAILKP